MVVTGLSGSGKSTLAFDTLYAEGQRRYVESLSTYARQFLERLEKPDVDLIEGLSPAIAIEQRAAGHNPRSTVGTVTEIYDYLRLLYARVGIPHCDQCGAAIARQSLDEMVDRIMTLPPGVRIILYAPLVSGQKGTHAALIARLKKDGFARIRADGRIEDLETVKSLEKNASHSLEVMVDRLVVGPGIGNRLADSLQLALAESGGRAVVDMLDAGGTEVKETLIFSEKEVCIHCGVSFPEFTPASFSFNSPQGACPRAEALVQPLNSIRNSSFPIRSSPFVKGPWHPGRTGLRSTIRSFWRPLPTTTRSISIPPLKNSLRLSGTFFYTDPVARRSPLSIEGRKNESSGRIL